MIARPIGLLRRLAASLWYRFIDGIIVGLNALEDRMVPVDDDDDPERR